MKVKRGALLTLFLIVFVDLLGIGIVIPILPGIFLETGSLVIPDTWTESMRTILLGIHIASYPLAQFIGAPILGKLSDRYGRKKLLSLSLMGTALGYLIFAYGLITHQLWLLFAGRILDGFTGGNIAVANSAIADLSPDSQSRAKNFGLIGMAFGLGFVLGPFLGGVLADPNLVSWFSPIVPFIFAGIITVINLILMQVYLPETLKRSVIQKISMWSGFTNIIQAFRLPKLRVMFVVAFLHAFGFAFFTFFFAVFLMQKFGFSTSELGFFFAYVGVWIAIGQGGVNRVALNYMKSEKLLKLALFLLAASLFIMTIPDKVWLLFIIQPFVAIFEGISFPNITAVISQISTDDQQGEVLGITQSIRALAEGVPPLISGFLVAIGPNMPTLVAAAIVFIAGLTYVTLYKPKELIK